MVIIGITFVTLTMICFICGEIRINGEEERRFLPRLWFSIISSITMMVIFGTPILAILYLIQLNFK